MRRQRAVITWLVLFVLLLGGGGFAEAGTSRLDRIRARGTLVVGVKTEYPPFGALERDGNIVGFEPDMAADLAHRLGLGLRLVGVNNANRLQKLADGSIDVLIATLGDTPERRAIVTLIHPDYYASGVNVMLPAARKILAWIDLQGQTMCTTQGAYFNRPLSRRYLLNLQTYTGIRDAMLAVRDHRCLGWLYDDTAIEAALERPEWRDFAMPLPSLMPSPWAIAIRQGDDGVELERLIGDAVADWHRSGFLVGLERKWHLQPSEFLAAAQGLWSEPAPGGGLVCARVADGHWPARCEEQDHRDPDAMTGLQQIGRRIEDLTGLDVSILYDAYDRDLYLHGLLTSFGLIVASVVGSILIAGLAAIPLDARSGWIRRAAGAITSFVRMTPPLLQLYIMVFGLGGVAARWGFTLDAFVAAAACLSLYAGSSSAAALIEAAAAIRHQQPAYRITPRSLPAAFGLAYQPVMSSLVNIAKATGMASVVAVPELISSSTAIIAERGNSTVIMNLLMVIYFLMVLAVMGFLARLRNWVTGHVAA